MLMENVEKRPVLNYVLLLVLFMVCNYALEFPVKN